MISRRDVLIGAAVAGAASPVRPAATAFAKAAQPSTPVNFPVPAGACDCHVHVFDPLPAWALDSVQREAILIDYPATLYGF
ncbi:MAG: hypothetical protein ACLP1Y_15510 [Candidatus Acidiferrales bacterium]